MYDMKKCLDCGEPLGNVPTWKVRCIDCWKVSKGIHMKTEQEIAWEKDKESMSKGLWKRKECTMENPIEGHKPFWRNAWNYRLPVCGKCGLVVHHENRELDKVEREIGHYNEPAKK